VKVEEAGEKYDNGQSNEFDPAAGLFG